MKKQKDDLPPENMNADQRECYQLLCDLVYGEHHLCGTVKRCSESGIRINIKFARLGTYDFDSLTRLVVMAHDRCIRVEVMPGAAGSVGLTLHKRHARTGSMFERHPTIEEAIQRARTPVGVETEKSGTVADYSDAELVRRAVMNATPKKAGTAPRWVAVMDSFGLGSTYATQLCRKHGLDPEEKSPYSFRCISCSP